MHMHPNNFSLLSYDKSLSLVLIISPYAFETERLIARKLNTNVLFCQESTLSAGIGRIEQNKHVIKELDGSRFRVVVTRADGAVNNGQISGLLEYRNKNGFSFPILAYEDSFIVSSESYGQDLRDLDHMWWSQENPEYDDIRMTTNKMVIANFMTMKTLFWVISTPKDRQFRLATKPALAQGLVSVHVNSLKMFHEKIVPRHWDNRLHYVMTSRTVDGNSEAGMSILIKLQPKNVKVLIYCHPDTAKELVEKYGVNATGQAKVANKYIDDLVMFGYNI